jgi:hypothetical protein
LDSIGESDNDLCLKKILVMKSFHLYIILAVMLLCMACQKKVMVILPPEGNDSVPFSGKGQFKSCLLVANNTPLSNTIPADDSTMVIGNNVADFFTSTDFGKPSNPTKLPYLNNNTIPGLTLQPLPAGMKHVDYPGAFGVTADSGWHVESNWFKIDPYEVNYSGQTTAEIITGNINANKTLDASKTYIIRGQVFVNAPAILTIPAGTVIFGDTDPNDGVLCINRGAKIVAQGTPDKPVIFTSIKNGNERQRGDWGGIAICGKAPNNKGTDVLIEGINQPGGDGGKYGGNVSDDNSGVLSYVRVEFAGIAITPGNEINGLTMGSVGSTTQLDHIIVTVAGDDGIEWFGGTVSSKYLGLYDVLDDDLDMDAGFVGNIQFVYSLRNPYAADVSLSGSLEITSSKTAGSSPVTNPYIANVTSVGPVYLVGAGGYDPEHEGGCRVSNDATPKFVNSVVIGWPRGVMNF